MANTAQVFQSIVTVDAASTAPVVTVYQSIVTVDVGDPVVTPTPQRPTPVNLPWQCCFQYLDNTGANVNQFPM